MTTYYFIAVYNATIWLKTLCDLKYSTHVLNTSASFTPIRNEYSILKAPDATTVNSRRDAQKLFAYLRRLGLAVYAFVSAIQMFRSTKTGL